MDDAMVFPRYFIVVLFDSSHRTTIGHCGSGESDTPNLDRLVSGAFQTTNHYAGRCPAFPLTTTSLLALWFFCGALWRLIEGWEESIAAILRNVDVATVLTSDCPYLFETEGENHHVDLPVEAHLSGHEGGLRRTGLDPSRLGTPILGRFGLVEILSDCSRGWVGSEQSIPGPRTTKASADWLENPTAHHDRLYRFVDELDPHERFDAPEPYVSMFGSPLGRCASDVASVCCQRQRHRCAHRPSNTSDEGPALEQDQIDRRDRWSDTAAIVTDYDHCPGERDISGKPRALICESLGHIPLLTPGPVACPIMS